jgi:uncharacterized protein YggU (UPF0235/DUF167 family)
MPPPPEARLTVEVRPRAGRDAIDGWQGGVCGHTARTKLVRVVGLDGAAAAIRLGRPVGASPARAAARST